MVDVRMMVEGREGEGVKSEAEREDATRESMVQKEGMRSRS